jgi:hypothetical protein
MMEGSTTLGDIIQYIPDYMAPQLKKQYCSLKGLFTQDSSVPHPAAVVVIVMKQEASFAFFPGSSCSQKTSTIKADLSSKDRNADME